MAQSHLTPTCSLVGEQFVASATGHSIGNKDSPQRADIIFVLAGRHERKGYGLQLLRDGLAPRLILSVGRFEVRSTETLGFRDVDLCDRAAQLPSKDRHFFIDIVGNSRLASARGDAGRGTYRELLSLARYLEPDHPRSLILVSTGAHLRRIRWCCKRIDLFRDKALAYIAVPERLSSFHRSNWKKRWGFWSYFIVESLKLAGYGFRYGSTKRTLDRLANSSLAYRDGIESQSVKGEDFRRGEGK